MNKRPYLWLAFSQEDEGWGVIVAPSSVAHYYRRRLPICSAARNRYQQRGQVYSHTLKPERGLKTDCKYCRTVIDKEKAYADS